MNKQILLTLLLLFAVVLSASAISASDVNVTDSYATNLVDDTQDVSVPMENTADSSQSSVSSDSNVDNDSSKVSLSSEEVLESENSNTLSTNTISNSNLGSENGIAAAASSDNVIIADSDVSSTIDLSKTIQANDVTKYYKGSTQFTATFLDINGKALANTNVKITVNGVTYTKKTNANGVASLAIDLKPGSYKVVSENPSTGYKLTNTFKILSTISATDISKVYTDSKKFTATFYKSNGNVLANKNIKFKINGKTYKVKTNAKGVASLSLTTLKAGTYKIISYNKDGLTLTNTVKVVNSVGTTLKANNYVFLKSDTKKIKVKLLNKFGYAPGKGKVVKFTINGKTYSAKTNANGNAKLKLPSLSNGVYTVKYKFAGNSFYTASSASSQVCIIPSKSATFTVKSGTSYTYGGNNVFKVAVTSGNVPITSKAVTFNVNGKSYTHNTDGNGVASLSISGLGIGDYTISYSIAKDSKVDAKSESTKIAIKEKQVANHNAYWLYGSDMKSVDLSNLASKGVTDILLNFKAYELYGKSGVESWIASANKVGIGVHMWVQVFYESSKWTNPVKNGKENTAFFTTKLNEIKTYAAISGLSGIHLDYIRYSGVGDNAAYKTTGGTDAISSFVKQAVTAAHAVNPNLIMSAALMPETTSSAYYYGQDYSVFSKYLDVVVPMIYKGNYNKDTSWITTTTKWYVDNSKGAKVWSGIQTYVSDNDETKLSTTDLNKDIVAARNGGAKGVILFRLGFSNSVDFNNLDTSSPASSGKTISIKNIIAGATTLKNYYASNSKLPSSVSAGGYTFTVPEFLYLMSEAIVQLSESNTKDIAIVTGISAPTSPSGDNIGSAQLYTYVTLAKNLVSFIKANNRAPNYSSSDVGNIIYSEVVDTLARVLAFYGTENRLPSYTTVVYGSSSSSSTTATGSGLNEKNTISNLNPYKVATTNCQVGASSIKNLAKTLTKGKTSDYEKALAIYNYVRDSISYSFYYNTKYGATGTLSAKSGNCVDQSHLLVALCRASGLAARYVHGTCKFSSGSTYGHVWAQILIDGKWTVADTTSTRNSLGKVNNWNTNSFTLKGIYSSLSF